MSAKKTATTITATATPIPVLPRSMLGRSNTGHNARAIPLSCWPATKIAPRKINARILWVRPFSNGFAKSALKPRSGHHHLIIKPEDVWFAILTELGLFMNTHTQGLRSLFVSHERELGLLLCDNRHSLDYRGFIKQSGELLDKHIVGE